MQTHESEVETTTTACELPTLLIVGDPNRLNIAREALIELELGWEVVFASSTFDALDIPSLREIDVILVDLGNPHIEGPDLVEALHRQFGHTPIVLMTAPYGVSVALECVRKGATNHFPRDLLDSEPEAVLETLRSAARERDRHRISLSRLDNQYFGFTLENDRREVPAVAGRLVDSVVELGLCDRTASTRIGVALEEALLNAIIHGNLEVSSELRQLDETAYEREIELRRSLNPFCQRQVKLTARICAKEAVFMIQDDGPGFDLAKVPDPTDPDNILRIGGRGLLLMRSFMTAVQFADGGRRVTMLKRRG